MSEFELNRRDFMTTYASLSNVRSISEYSVTVDREVVNDRTHARYLIEENIKDDVNFDLKKGIDTYIDKSEAVNKESRLHNLCRSACAEEGDNLKELFSGAEFAGSRGTMRAIAMTIMSHNPRVVKPENAWTIIAVRADDVILLCEITKKYGGPSLGSYSGFKFEQHMTSDKPNGEADTDSPVDNRPAFKKLIRSDLVFRGETIGICCAAEIDALRGETMVELKTRQLDRTSNFGYFKSLELVLQSELADVSTIVVGWKTDNLVVTKVTELPIVHFKSGLQRSDEQSLAFLFTILRFAQKTMEGKDACEISYLPERGVVRFKDYPKKEAMDLLTTEFKNKFNVRE